MQRVLATALKKNNKKLFLSLLILLLIVGTISVFSWIAPRTNTIQSVDSQPRLETTYDYHALVTPNVLHPNGGMVEVGDTLYKKITTAIPINVTTVIDSEKEVLAKGTYEVKLLVKAEGSWDRSFPLQNKQNFDHRGMHFTLIDNSYLIDLKQAKEFILQVEDETGIRHSQYELEVVPTIRGEIEYAGKVKTFDTQDTLKFNYLAEEIKLASEKKYSTAIQLHESQSIGTSFDVIGFSIPLILVRIISTSIFILLLLSILFSLVYLDEGPVNSGLSEADRISKKYGKRVIPISKPITVTGKTVVRFDSFTSMLKIADEIEQPIFFYNNVNDYRQMYLIVDVICVYTFEPSSAAAPAMHNNAMGNGEAYVIR